MFDVGDDTAHVVWGVPENFVGAVGPNGVRRGKVREEAKPGGCLIGEFVPDGFCIVAVAPHTQMHMIAQHRASPDRVPFAAHRILDRLTEGLPLRVVKPDQRKIEQRRGGAPEFTEHVARRLRRLSPVMDRTQTGELFLAHFVRPASAGVVGKPVPVPMQDEMMADNDPGVRPHCAFSSIPSRL